MPSGSAMPTGAAMPTGNRLANRILPSVFGIVLRFPFVLSFDRLGIAQRLQPESSTSVFNQRHDR